MKVRKCLDADFCVKVPNFHATSKYRLASIVSVISEPKNDHLGTAVAIEPTGAVHLITHGARFVKNSIKEFGLSKGNKFMCVGEVTSGKKREPRFEMIIDDAFQIQWDNN